MYIRVQYEEGPNEGIGSFGARVGGVGESPDLGTGNQT